ncbi:MAG TPA: magnesium/cobalt transporter CorA [Candidatus Limnocylindria bacterium]|nr:magnesium/cobalt transporter CorA [Candidatus Limnocylindria bacterium]
MTDSPRRTCLARLPDGTLRVLQGAELEQIDALRATQDQVVWLDILSPDEDDFALLTREFDLHELALEDLRKRRQRPKVDTYPDQHVIVAYEVLPNARKLSFELGELHLFSGAGYLVSVHWTDSPAIRELAERFTLRPAMVAPSVGALLYHLLDAVVDGYFPLLDRLSDRIDQLEDRVIEGGNTSVALRELLVIKRSLLELRRILSPQRDVANALLRRDLPLVDDAGLPYYQDLYDHLVRVLDAVDLYRDLVATTLDANLAVTSNNLNAVMKRLTALTVVLMLPTLIAGIYGMNFRFMPELAQSWGYPFALVLMAGVMVGSILFFRWRRWF